MFSKKVSLLHQLIWRSGLINMQGCVIGLAMVILLVPGCGTDGEQTSPSPTGSTVSLAWDVVNDPNIVGYYIHYGKQSPNQSGSCAYDRTAFVESHHSTVTGLDPGSTYYFAVSAYNGVRGDCSNEVSAQT